MGVRIQSSLGRPHHSTVSALSVLALIVAACTGGTATQSPSASTASPSSASATPVSTPINLTIGGIVPLTGSQAPFGAWEQKSIELGVKALNDAAKSAGVPLTVTAKIEDEGAGPDPATQAATKLVTAEGATCIVGPNNSADGIAIAKNVTVPRKVPEIGIQTTSPAITTLQDDGYYFRTTASDTKQAIVLANFAAQQLGGASGKTLNIGARARSRRCLCSRSSLPPARAEQPPNLQAPVQPAQAAPARHQSQPRST